jgi:hypothetical protein
MRPGGQQVRITPLLSGKPQGTLPAVQLVGGGVGVGVPGGGRKLQHEFPQHGTPGSQHALPQQWFGKGQQVLPQHDDPTGQHLPAQTLWLAGQQPFLELGSF